MCRVTKIFLFIFLSLGIFIGCTVDDICSEETQTTPHLVISFTDNRIPDILKPLAHLKVENLEYEILVWDAPADIIQIPLSTEADKTTYAFTIIKDEIEHKDIYEFSYHRKEVYVSRACGYKMLYIDLEANFIPNSDDTPSWSQNITVLNPIIEDEKKPHITILY